MLTPRVRYLINTVISGKLYKIFIQHELPRIVHYTTTLRVPSMLAFLFYSLPGHEVIINSFTESGTVVFTSDICPTSIYNDFPRPTLCSSKFFPTLFARFLSQTFAPFFVVDAVIREPKIQCTTPLASSGHAEKACPIVTPYKIV